MIGALMGLAYAVVFGWNQTVIRRGVLHASPRYIANVSILSAPCFFIVVTVVVGEAFKLPQFPWESYAFFAMSGIIHFAFGRTFSYSSIALIGATRSNLVSGLNAIVSVSLAIAILKESLTPFVTMGIILSVSGPLVMAWKEETVTAITTLHGKQVDRPTLYRGVLFGLGSAVMWGCSPVLIKMGIDAGGSSIVGSLTAFSSAALFISPSFLGAKQRGELLGSDRKSLRLALVAGMSTNIGHLVRYIAFGYGSVITVSLVSRTIPVWTLFFSFLMNRKVESFGRWVLIGNALLLIGSMLVVADQLFAPGTALAAIVHR